MSTQETKIITKIIRELSLYLLIHRVYEFSINLSKEEEVTTFTLSFNTPKNPKIIATMVEKISRERELEIETYGWELVGDIDETSELEISSLLLDEIHVQESNTTTTIVLTRKNQYRKKAK